jgi:hypothetical protein
MHLDPSFSNFTHPNIPEESIIECDDQSDSDDDDNDSDNYDSDDNSDDDSDRDDAKIIVSDDEHDEENENDEHDDVNENDIVINVNMDSTSEIVSETIDYNKMTLPVLKALVVEKGILEDASKMKKAKLVELIAQHSA